MCRRLLVAFAIASGVVVGAQSPAFDVVSIKPAAQSGPGAYYQTELPNGGVRIAAATVTGLLLQAFGDVVAAEIVGLPEWARRDAFDVEATASLPRATRDDRIAMLRAMLTDRFQFVAHMEKRLQPSLILVAARKDGTTGPALTRIDADCAAQHAADRAEYEAAVAEGRPPTRLPRVELRGAQRPCSLRLASRPGQPSMLDGQGTMADLARMLRLLARGVVVDRTGLGGSYRIALTFEMTSGAGDVTAPVPAGPDVSTALREQLGLKLESATIERDTLIVDRIERPSAN